MSSLRKMHKSEALSMANLVYQEMMGTDNSFSPQQWIDYHEVDVFPKAFKPHRWTLLHDYISELYKFQLYYPIDKHEPYEVIESLIDLFNTYCPDNPEFKKYSYQYSEYIVDKRNSVVKDKEGNGVDYRIIDELGYNFCSAFENSIIDIVVDDVFTVLFQSKNFLRQFNMAVSEIIIKTKKEDKPEILKSDGVIKRCSTNLAWLRKGVFYRDKGRCQECGKDVTGLLNLENTFHIDHIVPLTMGGTNDPTNFQLLCDSCNLSKGAKTNNTFDIDSPFWDQDKRKK
ncbi:HNH endonuclease [Paenibacillus sp. OK003]|nr:HNH endonuclease [Paenibacillus sp. OK003]